MVRQQVTKLSNPRRANRKRTRTVSPRSIAALKRYNRERKAQAHRKRTKRANARPRSINPAWVVTLGSNPHRRRTTPVPATKRRRKASNARRRVGVHSRRRVAARNPHHRRRTVAAAPRRRRRRVMSLNPRRHHRATNRRRTRRSNPRRIYVMNRRHRNPSLFGSSITSREGLKMIGGGFVGLIGAKFLPTLIPANMASNFLSTNLGRTVATGLAGYLTAVVAGKVVDQRFGDAVLFGAIIQTGSVALNAFLPSIYKSLGIGLGRVGDLVPGTHFSVPQNPLMHRALPPAPMSSMAPTGSVMVNSGMGRAYPAAY